MVWCGSGRYSWIRNAVELCLGWNNGAFPRSSRGSLQLVVHRMSLIQNASVAQKQRRDVWLSFFVSPMQVPSRRQKIVLFLQRLLSSGALLESLRSNTGPASAETTDSVLSLAAEAGLREDDLRSSLTETVSVSQTIEDHRRFCEDVLGLPRGTSAVVTNGRVTALPDSGPALHADDFSLLESLELRARAEKVLPIVEDADFASVEPDDLTSDFLSDVILGVTSALAARKRAASGTANFGLLKTKHSAILLEGDPSSPIRIEAVVDPLSPSAQKLTSLLVLLHEWLNPSIRIVLNPVSGLSDIPLKNFYR